MMNRIAATLAVMAASLASLAVSQPAQASAVTVPAERGATAPLVQVGRKTFPAQPQLISAKLSAYSPPPSSPHLMLAGVLICNGQRVIAGINLTTGYGTLTVRHIFRPSQPGVALDCTVLAQSALGYRSWDHLRVSVSWSSRPVSWSATSYNGTAWPTLVPAGSSYDAAPLAALFPKNAGYVKVRADFRSTACTVEGGSRENGSPLLCLPQYQNLAGTTFRLRVIASYGACGRPVVLTEKKIHIDKWLHHSQTYWSGTLPRGCSSSVKIKMRIDQVTGAALVAHSGGTALDLYR